MSIIVDLIVIGIITLFVFIGYKQGLIKSAIKILSFFIAIIVALTLYKPISTLVINNTNLDEKIQNSIASKILPEGSNSEDQVQTHKNVPDIILGAAGNTVNSISSTMAVKIIETATLIIIFILVKIILRFVTVLADLIGKIPILKQFNKARWNYIRFG